MPAARSGRTSRCPDRPDLAFEDLNCDGVDGDATRAYFVATTGDDTGGTGSLAVPFKTLQHATREAAKAEPKRAVYVMVGNYVERVELAGGVSLYGGYLPSGARSATDATTIQAPDGAAEAVFANGATGVALQLLTIKGAARFGRPPELLRDPRDRRVGAGADQRHGNGRRGARRHPGIAGG